MATVFHISVSSETNVTDENCRGTENFRKGIYIKEIEADSPGMAAGVQCGDIITAMDGDPVVTVKALHNKTADIFSREMK